MARRSGLGAFVKTVVKIGKEIDRANKRAERDSARMLRERERALRSSQKETEREAKERAREKAKDARESAQELRRQMKDDAKAEKASIKTKKAVDKASRQAEKEREAYLEMISEELHPMTEKEFGLGKLEKRKKTTIADWTISADVSYIKDGKKPFAGKIGSLRVDAILFNGTFNSVVGVDGIALFKKSVESLKISYDDKYSTQNINDFFDYVFVALLQSGTYDASIEVGPNAKQGWLIAFRYILVHDNDINTANSRSDFDKCVKDFLIPPSASDLFDQQDLKILGENLAQASKKFLNSVARHLEHTNSRRFIAKGA